jgi:hypothetical protein
MDHLKGRHEIKSKLFGRCTANPIEDEKRFAEDLLKMEKYGFGLSRKKVLELVGQYVNTNKIKTPFTDGVTAEEVKNRIVEEKDKNCKTVSSNAIASSSKDENLCSICKCDFHYYTNKEEWIEYVSCKQWICGICNKGSKKRRYEWEQCQDSD